MTNTCCEECSDTNPSGLSTVKRYDDGRQANDMGMTIAELTDEVRREMSLHDVQRGPFTASLDVVANNIVRRIERARRHVRKIAKGDPEGDYSELMKSDTCACKIGINYDEAGNVETVWIEKNCTEHGGQDDE